jgi:hypothetical protein
VKSIFVAFSRTYCDKMCLPKYREESALASGLNVFPPRFRFLIESGKQSSIADLVAPAFNGVNTAYRFPAIWVNGSVLDGLFLVSCRIVLQSPSAPESLQIREVYAYFGLAMYEAQNLERQLAMLLGILGKTEMSTPWDYDARLADGFQSTFGTLVTDFGRLAPAEDAEVHAQLEAAVRSRNDLAHHYFWDRALQFASSKGRNGMLEELRELVSTFESANKALTRLTRRVAAQKGLPEEKLRIHAENELEALRSGREKVYRPERVPNTVEIVEAYEWRADSGVKVGLIFKSK